MLKITSSDILCYTDEMPTFELLKKSLPDYNLQQVSSLPTIESELKDKGAQLVIFDASSTTLALNELMDSFKQHKIATAVIALNAKGQRIDALNQFELGVKDALNKEELKLLPFIIKREIQANTQLKPTDSRSSKPAVTTQISQPPKSTEQVPETKKESTPLAKEPQKAEPEDLNKKESFSPPKAKAPNKPKPSLSKQELDEMLVLLQEAIVDNKFQMLFQPLIQLGGDDTEYYEVLLRLPKEDGSLMSAGLFMNEPQVPDDIKKNIDRWVIAKAMKLLSSHLSKGSKARMFINLCSSSLADPKLASYIQEQISEHKVSKESIIFQFNEEDASSIEEEAVAFSNSLSNNFIPTSLSRFGMQPESTELCSKINPLFVKFNGYFSKNIHSDPELKTNTEKLLKKLKGDYKITIMPMVEDVATVSALWKMGTDFVQGFYVQAPVSGVSFDFSD